MSKILHVLVYVFLILAGAGLYFELGLNDKRSELTDRNRLQENYLIKLAKVIEKQEPDKSAAFEIKKDTSPVEAKLVDSPDMENILEDYPAKLEQANLETYNWDNANTRQQLRAVYVMDADGKPMMDGNVPLQTGPGTEDELLSRLFESAKAQQANLNSTRAALTDLRGKLEATVNELNKLKPIARQALIESQEKNEKIAKTESEKGDLANQITKLKSQADELNSEISSLKDEAQQAKDETEAAKEEIAKHLKMIEQLKGLLKESIQTQGSRAAVGGTAVAAMASGDKGKLVHVDNENMFAIVRFDPEALKELKGGDDSKSLPLVELGIRRAGFKGEAGEFIGRVRLRQEVKGKNLVVCDVLGAWEQAKAEVNDIVFAD